MRIANFSVAASIFLAVCLWFVASQQTSFAETVDAIANAETITWTNTVYERLHSKDSDRTWLRTRRSEFAYKHPGLYRMTRYDDAGNVRSITIRDTLNDRSLSLDMKQKTYKRNAPHFQASFHQDGAFGWVKDVLKNRSIELAGQRTVKGQLANVVRFRRPAMRDKERDSVDLWIDVKTKKLLGVSDPGANAFDPETMEDRDNPSEEEFSKGTLLGSITGNIVFDAEVDQSLFGLTPPDDFKLVVDPPPVLVTEAELVEWFRAAARVNNGTFVDSSRATDTKRIWDALRKEPSDRNDVEAELGKLWHRHLLKGNTTPTWEFLEQQTVEGSFRYVGKGVKLGTSDRIICWYKLKSTSKYRAVYGDLSIRDVSPEELPISVE